MRADKRMGGGSYPFIRLLSVDAQAALLRALRLAFCFSGNNISKKFWLVHSKAKLH